MARCPTAKRTKHIKTKYFFVANKVAQGDVVIAHKPTGEMWINVNTKPKQGTLFRTDHSHLINCPLNIPDETLDTPQWSISSIKPKIEQRSKEYVGIPRNTNIPTSAWRQKISKIFSDTSRAVAKLATQLV